jgi:Gpi18-like mannosyltransferase
MQDVPYNQEIAAKTVAERANLQPKSLFDAQLICLILAIKVLVLAFAAQSYIILSNRPLLSSYDWLSIWNRWDALHYLNLARTGYVSEGVEARAIAFYPLYPWLVRVTTSLLRDELAGAFFVSTIASVIAGLLLHVLAQLDEKAAVARATVFFMFIFPTSYFLHIGYTESLFLALVIGGFLAARNRRWWLAGLLGVLACMTRVNGLVLVPALAFEAWDQCRAGNERWRWGWFWVVLPVSGFGIYLLINFNVHGDPLAFLWAQEKYWRKAIAWPWVGIAEAWRLMSAPLPFQAQMIGWQEFFFVALGFCLSVWAWLRLRASYAVWMTGNWLLWTSTKFLFSVPRFTLVMFPAYILFARAAHSSPVWNGVITVWSLLFLALFVTCFVRGLWAF